MAYLRTEAVVLRSLRYGEADRILHLYTRDHGRQAGIAKGVRKLHSRLAGRLEPYQLVALELHLGRSPLRTVVGAKLLASNAGLRRSVAALDLAARAADALGRLFETEEPHPEAFNLVANLFALLNGDPTRASRALALSFRTKLLVVAGIVPRLAACAACGNGAAPYFAGAAGGVLCNRCRSRERDAFPLSREARLFLLEALRRPLREVPQASAAALRGAERALFETAAHHGQVRLLPAVGPYLESRPLAVAA